MTGPGATYTEGSRKRHLGHSPAFCKLSSVILDLGSSSSCDTWLTKTLQKKSVSRGREFMADYAFGSSRALRSKLVPGRGGGIKLGQLWSTLLEGSGSTAFLSFPKTGTTGKEDCAMCHTPTWTVYYFLQVL